MCADIHDGQEHKRSVQGPDTEAQDQSSPDHHIRLATHGRSSASARIHSRDLRSGRLCSARLAVEASADVPVLPGCRSRRLPTLASAVPHRAHRGSVRLANANQGYALPIHENATPVGAFFIGDPARISWICEIGNDAGDGTKLIRGDIAARGSGSRQDGADWVGTSGETDVAPRGPTRTVRNEYGTRHEFSGQCL